MNDTYSKISKIYNEMLMEKSNNERMLMGFSMFETAKKIVLASINNKKNLKVELFKRFYKNDFNEKKLKKIIRSIKKYEKKLL